VSVIDSSAESLMLSDCSGGFEVMLGEHATMAALLKKHPAKILEIVP